MDCPFLVEKYFFQKLPICGQLFCVLRVGVKGRFGMKGKGLDKELRQRIRDGTVRRQDVTRRLAELAFGQVNDCVRLVLEAEPELEKLDLSLLCEVKRNEKGTVEVKLIDRLRVLEQLARVAGEDKEGLDLFLRALQGGEEA